MVEFVNLMHIGPDQIYNYDHDFVLLEFYIWEYTLRTVDDVTEGSAQEVPMIDALDWKGTARGLVHKSELFLSGFNGFCLYLRPT